MNRRGYAPPLLAIPAIIGLAFLTLPLAALVGHVEWSTLWADITSPQALDALQLSVITGLVATALCLLLGVPLALLLARVGALTT
ncbi:molybdate ABC transporter permease subunit, partial [Rathayibacter sp. CAU 1779]